MAEGEGGALRSLLAYFRISVDGEQLKQADDKIGEFVEKLTKLGELGIWGEIAKKSVEFFKGQVEGAAHLQDVSEKLSIAVEDLTAFGFAAKSAGLDFDSAAFLLGRFQRALGGAGKGGAGTAEALKKLGINAKDAAKKDTIEVMLDLADAFQKMPTQAEKTAAAVRLFGRSGIAMVPILSKGRAALEEMFKESKELGSGLSGDFYKQSKQAREEFEHFEFAVSSLKERALAAVLPWIIKIGSWLKDTAKQVIEFTKHTNVLKTGLLFLGGVVLAKLTVALISAAAAMGLFSLPVIGAVAIVTLLYLAFDELWTMMNGGDTVIGRLIDSLFGIGTTEDVVEEVKEGWSDFMDVLDEVSGMVGELEDAFPHLGEVITDAFKSALEAAIPFSGTIKTIVTAIRTLRGAKTSGETEPEKEAREERSGHANRALFRKAEAAQKVTRERREKQANVGAELDAHDEHYKREIKNRADYASGKKQGTVEAGAITFGTLPPRLPVPGVARGNTAIHNEQKNDVRITVHADSNQPREIATTIDPVVKKALKDKYNALTSRTAP